MSSCPHCGIIGKVIRRRRLILTQCGVDRCHCQRMVRNGIRTKTCGHCMLSIRHRLPPAVVRCQPVSYWRQLWMPCETRTRVLMSATTDYLKGRWRIEWEVGTSMGIQWQPVPGLCSVRKSGPGQRPIWLHHTWASLPARMWLSPSCLINGLSLSSQGGIDISQEDFEQFGHLQICPGTYCHVKESAIDVHRWSIAKPIPLTKGSSWVSSYYKIYTRVWSPLSLSSAGEVIETFDIHMHFYSPEENFI